jgi:hypothetical protein
MTDVTNLDKAKTAYYEDTQALLNRQPDTIDKAGVEAIYASLSPEEDRLFEQYRTEVNATLYDFMMGDQSPEMRAAIDLFIKDNVQTIHTGVRVPEEERHAIIGGLPPMEAMQAIVLISHPVTRARIVVQCLNLGMTHEQIAARIAELNDAHEAEDAKAA